MTDRERALKFLERMESIDGSDFFADERHQIHAMAKVIREQMAALEYYAHPEHYEERVTLKGVRPPGVMVNMGTAARAALDSTTSQLAALESKEE